MKYIIPFYLLLLLLGCNPETEVHDLKELHNGVWVYEDEENLDSDYFYGGIIKLDSLNGSAMFLNHRIFIEGITNDLLKDEIDIHTKIQSFTNDTLVLTVDKPFKFKILGWRYIYNIDKPILRFHKSKIEDGEFTNKEWISFSRQLWMKGSFQMEIINDKDVYYTITPKSTKNKITYHKTLSKAEQDTLKWKLYLSNLNNSRTFNQEKLLKSECWSSPLCHYKSKRANGYWINQKVFEMGSDVDYSFRQLYEYLIQLSESEGFSETDTIVQYHTKLKYYNYWMNN